MLGNMSVGKSGAYLMVAGLQSGIIVGRKAGEEDDEDMTLEISISSFSMLLYAVCTAD